MDKDTILAVGVTADMLDRLRAAAGFTVVALDDAEAAADRLWTDGEAVSEIVIGSDAFDADLRETLRRDWPNIKVKQV